MKPLIPIGKIGKPHGLKGDFYLAGRNELLQLGQTELFLGKTANSARQVKVARSQVINDRDLLRIEGLDDRTAVEEVIGQTIWVEETATPVGFVRHIGKEVVDSDGVHVGEVVDIMNFGASDLIKVQTSNGSCLDLPFVPHYFDAVDDASEASDHQLKMQVPIAMFAGLAYQVS